MKAIDTYWICTAEHGLNASTFTARIVASTGADCGAALSSARGRAVGAAARRRADAYVKPMLDEVEATGDRRGLGTADARSRRADHGLRPPRLPRRGPALADPEGDGARARLAADRDCRATRGGGARRAERRKPDRPLSRRTSSTTPRSCSTSPRSRRRSRPRCSRARALRAGRPTSSSRSGRAGSSGRRALRRAAAALARRRRVLLTLAEAAARADALGRGGQRARARDASPAVGRGARVGGEVARLPRARRRVPRDRAVPLPAEDRAAAPRARGREPRVPRIGAARARAAVARRAERRERGSAPAPRARRERRERRGSAARGRHAQERLGAERHDPDPDRRSDPTTSSRASCARPPRRWRRRCAASRPRADARARSGNVSASQALQLQVSCLPQDRARGAPAAELERVLRQAGLHHQPGRGGREDHHQCWVWLGRHPSSFVDFLRACGCAWKYNSRRRRSDTCVYSSVVARSACPSISWTLRRSAPPSSRCVANECRSRCGCTRSGSRPARSARRRRMRNAPARVSAPPFAFRKMLRPVPAVEVGPPAREVAANCLGGLPPDGHDPLLAALPDDADEPLVEVDGALLRPTASETRSPAPYRSSTSARSRSVRGVVAEAASIRRSTSPGDSVRGKPPRAAREGDVGSGVVVARAEELQVAEERARGGRPARDRRRRQPARPELGRVLLDVVGGCVRDGLPEMGAEGREVAAVRIDRTRRPPRREEREEAVDVPVTSHLAHFGPFARVPARAPAPGGPAPGRGRRSRSRSSSRTARDRRGSACRCRRSATCRP